MIERLLRPHLRELIPYSTARDEFEGEARVFLDANENPFGGELARYPDPRSTELRRMIAKRRSVSLESICVGNGSDEIIDLIIRAVASPGDRIAITPPTYGMYAVAARVNGVGVTECPLTSSFELDIERLSVVASERDKVLFLCSPNNPTGNQLTLDQIRGVSRMFPGLVVVDEAYIDFAKGESAVQLIEESDRIVVIQTLSKAWGLAGARVGIAIASPIFIAALMRMKLPYNLSALAQRVACQRLSEPERYVEEVKLIVDERERLRRRLGELSAIERVYPSEGNFLLVRCRDSAAVVQRLRESGIIVRDRGQERGCQRCVRITVGTPSENDQLLRILEEIV
jgi:histidinol-phosphate aminotransferase